MGGSRLRLVIGVVVAVLAVSVVGVGAASGGWWPWGKDDKPARTKTMRGWVRCGGVTSLHKYPLTLELSRDDNRDPVTLSWAYPNDGKVIVMDQGPDNYTYAYAVNIPAGKDKSVVNWSLTCGERDGRHGTRRSGNFDVTRNDAYGVNICQKGSLLDYCTSPAVGDLLGGCALAVLLPGMPVEGALELGRALQGRDVNRVDIVALALGESGSRVLAGVGQLLCVNVSNPQPNPGQPTQPREVPVLEPPPTAATLPVPETLPTLAPVVEPPPASAPVPTELPPTPTPAPTPTPTPTSAPAPEAPRIATITVTVPGPRQVRVVAAIGWDIGRDPITCHYLIDGTSVWDGQCGVAPSITLDVPEGYRSVALQICDREGLCSTSSTVGVDVPAPQPVPIAPPEPPQVVTYAETTGGVTNTWTNYMNAGGTAGERIPRNATVQISCRLQGFAVANGNTWWYRIAQAPWSNQFYASADAFYNNGQTSGSLLGTPYVDEAVPLC